MPEPLTVPEIVSPVPQVGRTVEGVMATPVGTRAIVNVRLLVRVTPAALVATARKLYRVLGRSPPTGALTATADVP